MDVGALSKKLGWCVNQHLSTWEIHISRPHLCQAFFNAVGMHTAEPAATPYIKDGLQAIGKTKQVVAPELYQRALGILRYIVDSTRPDLAVVACHLSKPLQRPSLRH